MSGIKAKALRDFLSTAPGPVERPREYPVHFDEDPNDPNYQPYTTDGDGITRFRLVVTPG